MDLLQPGTRAMQNCDTGKRAGEEEGGNRNEKRSCQVRHLDYNRPVNLSPIFYLYFLRGGRKISDGVGGGGAALPGDNGCADLFIIGN